MICVLLVPSLVCVLWMSIFGGTAINQVITENYTAAQDAALELQLFRMLDQLPIAAITSFIGITLVIVFFVTSSDSGSLVDAARVSLTGVPLASGRRGHWNKLRSELAQKDEPRRRRHPPAW